MCQVMCVLVKDTYSKQWNWNIYTICKWTIRLYGDLVQKTHLVFIVIFLFWMQNNTRKGGKDRQTDGQTDMLRAEPHAEMPSMFFELQHV